MMEGHSQFSLISAPVERQKRNGFSHRIHSIRSRIIPNRRILCMRTRFASPSHRQWEKYNLTNSIAIYDDHIEIANPGIFPPQITPESIKEPHESYPYNLKIAEALYKSTYQESWGSGAKRIIDAYCEQGVEEPVWRWDGGFVIITFTRPKYDPSTTQVGPEYVPTTTQVQQLIELMGDEYMGMKEIMELFDLKSVKRFRENYIQPALAEGAIERLYPNLPNHPKQKYRLTESAKEWKENV
ncbi:Fic family protein [Alistipes ihumii]|uniref:Fic family protein n=1 Tax=Alistipes ihumii TaxID=1470347 RepID=UPI002352D0CD|nr:ATP-binding protein [Alistipes ihumii]